MHVFWRITILAVAALTAAPLVAEEVGLPAEPVAIGQQPQFVFDHWIVENYWAIKQKRQAIQRVVHQPVKHAANPVFKQDNAGYPSVVHDEQAGLFRMYYQANLRTEPSATKGPQYRTYVAYAESKDGVR